MTDGEWGPLDDFDDDEPEQPNPHPPPRHDYRSPACVHRRHRVCDTHCEWCAAECTCVCHRAPFPVEIM